MSTVVNLFSHTLGKKVIMSLTGLFLILFITIHLAGNLQLLTGDAEAFNEYTYTMTSSPLILVASYVTYICILLHAIYGVMLGFYNRTARPVPYAYNEPSKNSTWSSRSMLLLGSVVLIFIVLHMGNFWYKYKFGVIPEVNGLKDMYTVVEESFKLWWYVAIYVIAMIGLGYHLAHGFQSAFQTLGINHKAYTPLIKGIGLGYSILVSVLFALIPIYMFITSL